LNRRRSYRNQAGLGAFRLALDSLLDPLSADHAQLAGAGDPARRVQRPRRP